MSRSTLLKTFDSQVSRLPILDTHTHVVGGKLGASALHKILTCHMVISDPRIGGVGR